MRDNEAFSKELEQAEKNLYTRRKFMGLAGTAAAALGLGTFLAGCSDGSGSGEGDPAVVQAASATPKPRGASSNRRRYKTDANMGAPQLK